MPDEILNSRQANYLTMILLPIVLILIHLISILTNRTVMNVSGFNRKN